MTISAVSRYIVDIETFVPLLCIQLIIELNPLVPKVFYDLPSK